MWQEKEIERRNRRMKERQIKKRRRQEKGKELTLVSLKNVTNQTSSLFHVY